MSSSEIFITKRDGKRERFSIDKIRAAIAKAFLSVGSFATDEMLTQILGRIRVADGTTVEQIQNQVETALMAERYYKVAKAYIIYRQEHTEDREVRDKLQFLMNYCEAKNPATGSKYDANANVENKNIATLIGELPKQNFIRLNRRLLTDRLKEMYGKEVSDRYPRIPDVHELLHRAGVRRGLLPARRRGGRPLAPPPHDRQGHHRLLRTGGLLDQPAHRRTQLPGRLLEYRLLRPLLLRIALRRVPFPRRVAPRLGGAVVVAETLHEVVQRRTAQNRAHLPRRDDGAADPRRRRDGRRVGRLHGPDVRRRTFVLHLHERQRRLAVVVLPPAQRDPGQRIQLHAGSGRRLDRFEERADDQPQPLYPVRRAAGHSLPVVPRRGGRPYAQGAAGLQREPQRAATQGNASALRRGLHQPVAPVPHHRHQRPGRSGRIQGDRHRRQPRLRALHRGDSGVDRALQPQVPLEGGDVQLRDDPRRKRGREACQMGSRGRL